MRHLALSSAVCVAVVTTIAADAGAGDRFVTEPANPDALAAVQYAALDGDACLAALATRGVPFVAVPGTRGVDTPVRLTGPLRGVTYRVAIGAARPEDDHRTIGDCRLLLALDDLSQVLAAAGVVEARYYSMYRKGCVGFVRPGKRHAGARAIDLVSVVLADGATYSVQGDFHPRPRTPTCGDRASAPSKDTPGARFWRGVVCAMDDRKSFNLLISPNHDWGHRDHLHMEVRSGITWFLVH